MASESNIFERELLRLTFSGIILASFMGALSLNKDASHLLNFSTANIAVKVLGISAIFSFLYLLSVAASLKYRSPSKIDQFSLTPKVMAFFYDTSINIFGLYLIAWVAERIFHNAFHWNLTLALAPVFLVIFSVSYFVARVLWVYVRRLIERYYDSTSY